jgi:hypothetical protein
MPPWIIFRGHGQISQEEYDELDAIGVGYAFQADAWADGQYSRKWLRSFVNMLQHYKLENQLLFLDAATSQTTQAIKDIALAGKVFPFFFEGGNTLKLTTQAIYICACTGITDLAQPVDHGLGAFVKRLTLIHMHTTSTTHTHQNNTNSLIQPLIIQHTCASTHTRTYTHTNSELACAGVIGALYKVEVQVNFKEWRSYEATGALSQRNRRWHMANWLAYAWAFLKLHPEMIEDSFKQTVLVKLDGTHELKYKGLDKYDPPSSV